jgi:hypothetical protein
VRPRCSGRAVDQAQSAYEHVVNGYTREEREIAVANVRKAIADIEAVQSTDQHPGDDHAHRNDGVYRVTGDVRRNRQHR